MATQSLRVRRREQGVCTQCGGQLDTIGLVTCASCRAIGRIRMHENYAKNPAKQQERVYQRYYALKAAGKCAVCGRADTEPGKTLCPACNAKNRARQKRYAEERKRLEAAEDALFFAEYGISPTQFRTKLRRGVNAAD